MNKKKIAALLVAGITTLGVVGGTLAWFTASDKVTNIFKTGETDIPKLDAGIKVDEKFLDKKGDIILPDPNGDYTYNTPVTPNEVIVKNAWLRSTANYNQIGRARVVKNFVDLDTGKIVTKWKLDADNNVVYGDDTLVGGQPLNLAYIVLANNLSGSGAPAGWTIQTSAKADTSNLNTTNWYYYNKIIVPENAVNTDYLTSNILTTVTLAKEAGNEYKNLRFDVRVEGESIQSSHGAINDISVWQNVPQNIKDLNEN